MTDTATTIDPLDAIASARDATEEARRALDDAVRQARAAGASYAEVGLALGVTRQAAWERFHHLERSAS